MSEYSRREHISDDDLPSRFREVVADNYTSGDWAKLKALADESMNDEARIIDEYPLVQYESFSLTLGASRLPQPFRDYFRSRTGFNGEFIGRLDLGDKWDPVSFLIGDISHIYERGEDGGKKLFKGMDDESRYESGVFLFPLDYISLQRDGAMFMGMGPGEGEFIGMGDKYTRELLENAVAHERSQRLRHVASSQCFISVSDDGQELIVTNLAADNTTVVGSINPTVK